MVQPIPKVCGADVELSNFILGRPISKGNYQQNTAGDAAGLLLRQVDGVAQYRYANYGPPRAPKNTTAQPNPTAQTGKNSYVQTYNPQDRGRKFLPQNGGCIYIDLDHLEICIPEVTSASDHLSAWLAMVDMADDARLKAQACLPEGEIIEVLANNSDGFGQSYGSHLNMLITRECLDNILHKNADHLLYLASYLASSVIFTGQGKVGREHNSLPATFQMSQRADFFESLLGPQTTYHRPLINTRDEDHCDLPYKIPGKDGFNLARLHLIFFDVNLCHVAHYLKVGVTQIVLAMLEQNWPIQTKYILKRPVPALGRISRDLDFTQELEFFSGGKGTALDIQFALWEDGSKFVDSGKARGIVPEAEKIMDLWGEVLDHLHKKDWDQLAPCLDWVLKRSLIERAMDQAGLHWSSPELKHLDHLYSNLDRDNGLFWNVMAQGGVRSLVSEEEVEQSKTAAPKDTRAYLRAQILRELAPYIQSMDWSFIRLNIPSLGPLVLDLSHPLEGSAMDYQGLFDHPQDPIQDPWGWFEKLKSRLYVIESPSLSKGKFSTYSSL